MSSLSDLRADARRWVHIKQIMESNPQVSIENDSTFYSVMLQVPRGSTFIEEFDKGMSDNE